MVIHAKEHMIGFAGDDMGTLNLVTYQQVANEPLLGGFGARELALTSRLKSDEIAVRQQE